MLKPPKKGLILAVGAGLAALTLGAAASTMTTMDGFPFAWMVRSEPVIELEPSEESAVLPLVGLSPAERAAQLEAIAQGRSSADQARARYLLATDLIQQNRGGAALTWLEGLDTAYPTLAAYVLAKRAQALTASSQPEQAQATWQELLQRFPEEPVAAEALFALGQTDRAYWQQAIAQFPAHPRSVEIAQTLLRETPNQPQLLLLLARHAVYLPGIAGVLDQLVANHTSVLTPADWEAIAFAYWENGLYDNAGKAYVNAPATPLNLYRVGRGAQLGRRTQAAIAAYQQLNQSFPEAPETATALLRLAQLAPTSDAALPYLDAVVSRFPDRAGDALLEKSKVLDELKSPELASQVRQQLLSDYSQSDAAAELRWTLAEQRFEKQDIQGAWDLARQLTQENPDSEYAPEAAFWIGKWAQQQGRNQEAQVAYKYVLSRYPESYYAWRSAAMLGWDVGDFTTVRQKLPPIERLGARPVLPAGSETLRDLHQLGQDQDAWALWQTEFKTPMQPSVAEQFTDGVLRLGVGDNLDGIYMISSLRNRELADDRQAYQALRQQVAYWRSLFPFPFFESTQRWAQERRINPLLITALMRQESRFEPKIVSSAGATGLMQLMPSTAEWVASQVDAPTYDLNNPDDNIKLGTWYLDYTHDTYSDNSLFAVASYNAGPGTIANWIERFGYNDPDWFVEQIPYPETKGYVEAVLGNYWNYLRLYNPTVSAQLAQLSPGHAAMHRVP